MSGSTAGFYAIEATVHRSYLDPIGPADLGYLAQPSLALCEIETGVAAYSTLTFSDAGYRTLATDPSGVVAYEPAVIEAFSVDVSANLDPTKTAVAAAWGSLKLNNMDHALDPFITGWQSDGQSVVIYRGTKTLEQFPGQATARATAATFVDGSGLLEPVSPGVVRAADYSLTLTPLAKGATNQIRNSSNTGAVVGTPGTLPTNWSYIGFAGVAGQVVATGTTLSGLPYIDIRVSGTPTAGNFCSVYVETASQVNSVNGATWTLGLSTQLIAGTTANLTAVVLDFVSNNSSGAGLSDNTGSIALPTASEVRASATRTISTANAFFVQTRIQWNMTVGTAVDFTVRIAGVQLEGGSSASAFVATTSAVATRAPTFTAGAPATLNEAAATNYVTTGQTPAATNMTVTTSLETSAPMTGGTMSVFKSVRNATGADTNSGMISITNAPAGAAIRGSVYVWLPSMMPTKTSIVLNFESNVGSTVSGTVNQSLRDQWQRVTCSAVLTAGQTSTSAVLRVTTQLIGDTLYTTGWQIESDTGAATSYIVPSAGGGATLRAADLLYAARGIWLDPAYASLVPVFRGVLGPWVPEPNQVSLLLRDASYYLERPVPRTIYGGTGARDGQLNLTGVAKPLLYAGYYDTLSAITSLQNIVPLLIDPANLVYQFDAGNKGYAAAVYDGGLPLTLDTIVSDIYGSAPVAGHAVSDGQGLLRVGSSPVFNLTADVANLTSVSAVAVVAYTVLTGVLAVPSTLISSGSYADYLGGVTTALLTLGANPTLTAEAVALLGGLYIASGDTIDGITFMSRLLGGCGALLVPSRDGKLRLFVLSAIPGATVSALTFDDSVIVSITPMPLPNTIDPPPLRMRLGYGRNWNVQTSQLAGAISAARQTFVSAATRVVTGVASAASSSPRPTDPPVIGTDSGTMDLSAPAPQLVVNGMAALWGSLRKLYEIVVPASVGLTLDWGSVVTVISDFDGLSSPGKQGQIVGWRYSSLDSTATFKVLV